MSVMQNQPKQQQTAESGLDGQTNDDSCAPPSSSITCCRQNDESQPFTITCTSKPHQSLQILGVQVVSEARIVEAYSDGDGYLKSCRGCEVSHGAREEEEQFNHSNNAPQLYRCALKLDDPISSVTFKFLGLGDRSSFTVHKLHILLMNKDMEVAGCGGGAMGSIDMSKVRGYLQSMATVVPQGGQDLLTAVEQYQQSQSSQMSQMFGAADPAGLGDPSRLSGLLSMAARFGGIPPVSSGSSRSHDNPQSNGNTEQQSHDSSSVNQPKLPPTQVARSSKLESSSSGVLGLLMKTMSESQSPPGDDGGDRKEESMLKLLQGICSRVSDLRVSDTEGSEKEKSDIDKPEKEDEVTEKTSKVSSVHPGSTVSSASLEQLQTHLEQTVSQLLEASEQRLRQYIDTSLVAMETRICQKLDTVMQMLQKNGHPTHEQESVTESNE